MCLIEISNYRKWLAICLLFFVATAVHAQRIFEVEESKKKGDLFIYWGWNRTWYGNSDIHFSGVDYDFTISDVWAQDKPSELSLKNYVSLKNLTIPQFNFRLGYFINDRFSISLGTDHMKYVVVPYQLVKLNGTINDRSEIDLNGVYQDQNIFTHEGFLQFEHTDGLNYINVDVRRFQEFAAFGKVKLAHTFGLGTGILLPKTNTVLFNQERYDKFHVSGFGVNGIVGMNATFFNYLFAQFEFKPGFINMPDIRTSNFEIDKASQKFLFYQFNMVFGVSLNRNKSS